MQLSRKLLKDMDDHFWSLSKYSSELKDKRSRTFTLLYYYSAILYFGMMSCGLVLALFPLTASSRSTPFSCYKIYDYETNNLYYWSVYGSQLFNVVLGGSLVTAYDGLFLDLVARLLFELMVLSDEIMNLDLEDVKESQNEREMYDKVKEYVDHHNMLLR